MAQPLPVLTGLAEPMPEPAPRNVKVSLRSLIKRYNSVTAVDNVDLEVEDGEFLTLLGPSGSGKTTILMMLAGLIEPSAGQILIDGQDSTRLPPYRRDVGVVFQNYALFPHLTVAENVAFPLRMRRVREAEIRTRVTEALDLIRLPGVGNRHISQLSGGQQQRVALARALVFRPSLVLMDEPLGALDKKLRDEMQLEIRRIQQTVGITAIYVTHDQQEALTMSDRIAVMSEGRILQVAPPAELYNRPSSRFVASFLGESNFLSGRVSQHRQESTTLTITPTTDDGRELSIQADGHNAQRDGDPVEVVVRPEHFQFASGLTGFDNISSGTIEAMTYVGDSTRYSVRLDIGHVVTVKRLNDPTSPSPAIGDQVLLGWSKANTVCLRDVSD